MVVSRIPRETSRESIVGEGQLAAPTYSKPWGLAPPLPARCEPNPPQPVFVRPSGTGVLAVLLPYRCGAHQVGGTAGNDDGVAAGLGGGAAVADPLPAAG